MSRRRAAPNLSACLCLVVACHRGAGSGAPRDGAASAQAELDAAVEAAATGVVDPTLAAILRDHWAWALAEDPIFATRLGVHAFDDRVGDPSDAARARSRAARDALATRLAALGELSPEDALNRDLLLGELRAQAATDVCRFDRWRTSANDNPLARWGDLPHFHPLRTRADVEHLAARYEAMGPAIDVEIALLREGKAAGLVADAESIRRVVAMIDGQLATPLEAWSLLEPLTQPGVPEDLRPRLRAAIEDGFAPALRRYRDLLADELLPAARPDGKGGVGSLPFGAACYDALIVQHTTLPMPAQDVHALGLAEIARIDGELAALGKKALGAADLAATLAALRGDPALFFATPQEVEGAASDALARAKAAMPRYFGRLPKADCVVQRVPAYKAPYTTLGYYEPAHADGSKPGEYFINVLDPQTRPRYEARVLAVHESIPGHHLQIAIGQELDALPTFRRHAGYSAFVEGWALYTERLADEMGLYETDLDRLGMLSFDAWRAARLVVDTGIHTKGWTRAQAEAFMLEHTALAPNNISNEVDRYVGWPGQALAYKIGQREILALRRAAEQALGERFELAAFHDVVLGAGAVTLPVLRARVQAYAGSGSIDHARIFEAQLDATGGRIELGVDLPDAARESILAGGDFDGTTRRFDPVAAGVAVPFREGDAVALVTTVGTIHARISGLGMYTDGTGDRLFGVVAVPAGSGATGDALAVFGSPPVAGATLRSPTAAPAGPRVAAALDDGRAALPALVADFSDDEFSKRELRRIFAKLRVGPECAKSFSPALARGLEQLVVVNCATQEIAPDPALSGIVAVGDVPQVLAPWSLSRWTITLRAAVDLDGDGVDELWIDESGHEWSESTLWHVEDGRYVAEELDAASL